MLVRWLFTVFSLTTSWSAISWLFRPATRHPRTSRSRAVSRSPGGAGRAQRPKDVVILVVVGQHDDLGAGAAGAQGARRLHAVHAAHAHIHEHDAGREHG